VADTVIEAAIWGKKPEKGFVILCGSDAYALMQCLLRIMKDLRHIIWRESAMI
jgi:hypothetical protein